MSDHDPAEVIPDYETGGVPPETGAKDCAAGLREAVDYALKGYVRCACIAPENDGHEADCAAGRLEAALAAHEGQRCRMGEALEPFAKVHRRRHKVAPRTSAKDSPISLFDYGPVSLLDRHFREAEAAIAASAPCEHKERVRVAKAMLDNTCRRMEEALQPEWQDAQREVWDGGNFGWVMIAVNVIGQIREQFRQAEAARDHHQRVAASMAKKLNDVAAERDEWRQTAEMHAKAQGEAERQRDEAQRKVAEWEPWMAGLGRLLASRKLSRFPDDIDKAFEAERRYEALVSEIDTLLRRKGGVTLAAAIDDILQRAKEQT